jgi:hypothetical protein
MSGELVMKPCMSGGKQRGFAVLCHNPKPLEVGPRLSGFVSVGTKGVKLHLKPPPFTAPVARMPSFKDVFRRM